MSGALAAGSQLFSIGSQALSAAGLMPAFIRAGRSIGTIIPDVTIEEHHHDRLEITQHPVAKGTPISDHAYRMPAEVTMRLGWTNSNPIGSIVGGAISGFAEGGIGGALGGAAQGAFSSFTEQRVKDVYQTLIDLQTGGKDGKNLKPFALTTGKRNYDAMMISDLSVTTDRHTEYALIVEARMREVIIVQPQETTAPAQADQADPSRTAQTQDSGPKQPDPKDLESFAHKNNLSTVFPFNLIPMTPTPRMMRLGLL
jgi:hypothetical protein